MGSFYAHAVSDSAAPRGRVAPVLYRDGSGIGRVSRERFADLVESGAISQDTVVFDNTVTSAGAVRDGRWELPAANSWHGRAFF